VDTKKQALVEIAGAKNVIDDPAILESYAADLSYAPKRKPRFVVHLNSGTQVRRWWLGQTARRRR